MSELTDLYQELILDHNRSPRNFRRIQPCAHMAVGHNPLCGDRVTVYVTLDGDRLKDVAFEGKGCAICTASSSLMTEAVKGRTRAEADALFQRMHALLTSEPEHAAAKAEGMGKLAAFAGVSEFPMRVKCASLAWHTLVAALAGRSDTVKTEEDA
jgi:nitrogen fixation protein NifU and related proteins